MLFLYIIVKIIKKCSQYIYDIINHWLSGLGVWFLLWVQEVPGSNPGWALVIILFCLWCWYRGSKINARGHSDLNQGPTGLQPGALPLSYIPNLQITWKITFTFTLFHKGDKKCFCQKGDSNPCPHKRTRNLILTSYQEARIEPWVWRLRPLGHSDISLSMLVPRTKA